MRTATATNESHELEWHELAMSEQENSNVIVGLGQTGYSLARHFARTKLPFRVVDSRSSPALAQAFLTEFPNVELQLGGFENAGLDQAERLLLSPGIALNEPSIAAAISSGVSICSDIDLFCELVDAPIVAITGSNAKSTVTTLVGNMAREAGLKVGVGGNIGVPVLDLLAPDQLEQGAHDIYVLELSSFQLDITTKLRADVACVLNLSADHMDRYDSLDAYRKSKQRIFTGCRVLVNNLADSQLPAALDAQVEIINFTHEAPLDDKTFGLVRSDQGLELARGNEMLMPVAQMKLRGNHNYSNALAALAIGQGMDLPMGAMLEALKSFTGLEHRCQWVAKKGDVEFYNDSKGTNVGATIAALNGIGESGDGKIILIAGGDAKGAAFDPLIEPVAKYTSAVILIGQDAAAISSTLSSTVKNTAIEQADSLEAAVQTAWQLAKPGDSVLLSPACASTDMFSDYRARGRAFVSAVERLR